MLISFHEIIDIVIMSAFMGYLFKDAIKPVKNETDVVDHYLKKGKQQSNFLFSAAVIAPSIIIHELAHKFVAMGFGLNATFHAFYANPTTLTLGVIAIISKLTGFGFVFLVPGFVSIIGQSTPFQHALIAFAGPAIHGIFYLGAQLYIKLKNKMTKTESQVVYLLRYLNGFLFILNMLPIPGIDGYTVYHSLFAMF